MIFLFWRERLGRMGLVVFYFRKSERMFFRIKYFTNRKLLCLEIAREKLGMMAGMLCLFCLLCPDFREY